LREKNRDLGVPEDVLKDNPELITDPVFLIGNGNSRKDFDLERLRGIGTIIGCNALYREFTPDLLVIIDQKMMRELNKSDYLDHAKSIIIPTGRTQCIPGALKWRTKRFNTSGSFAMQLITQVIKPKNCYMLGMDSYPGNVYDKTENYAPNSLQNFSGVLSFYLKCLQAKGDTMFTNVNKRDAWEGAAQTAKYRHISYEEFENEVVHQE
jgi:hypothetical protein